MLNGFCEMLRKKPPDSLSSTLSVMCSYRGKFRAYLSHSSCHRELLRLALREVGLGKEKDSTKCLRTCLARCPASCYEGIVEPATGGRLVKGEV